MRGSRLTAALLIALAVLVACGGSGSQATPTPTASPKPPIAADRLTLVATDLPGFTEVAAKAGPVPGAGMSVSSYQRAFNKTTPAGPVVVTTVAVMVRSDADASGYREAILRGTAGGQPSRLADPHIGQGSALEKVAETVQGVASEVFLLAWSDHQVVCDIDYLAPAGTIGPADIAALAAIQEARVRVALAGA
jgi:hypothetical protein